jgi:ATP-dependent helicase HepA
MIRETWAIGQRWVSDSEPELGLGIVTGGGDGRIDVSFPAAGETRCYAFESAPLRRVRFEPGDQIEAKLGAAVEVLAVREDAGLLVYETGLGPVPEAELSDAISFSKPEERLIGGKVDEPGDFDLRGEALRRRAEMRRSRVRGLIGARMALIPHQLYIADEVAGRPLPRVLLADEVGLGKTIEACLIVHRLLLTGRAARVLILVPEPLVHQWFVELLRRFQLSFSLFDEERCAAIEQGEPGTNPFLDSQWVLAAVEFLAENEGRAAQAVEAGWDVLVVDEAHHLEWSPAEPGARYEVVRRISEGTEGLLLLTATPQQLGPEGHFARLRLLDPARYMDLEQYREETAHYEEIAAAVEELERGGELGKSQRSLLRGRRRLEEMWEKGDRAQLMEALLDGFGVGRVMFRNTREKLGGFPERQPRLVRLEGDDEVPVKLEWLVGLLDGLDEEKVLVIVRTKELAEQVEEWLRTTTDIVAAIFHEDLTLLQRDRNAAFFAENDGARVLVCSEIGSEGRNFQFARHLVLLDLPEDVDLLEQRIGRLDRIGQRGTIVIHVPYLAESAEEVRVRWLDEGLDAFRRSPRGAAEIQREMAPLLAKAERLGKVGRLIGEARAVRERIASRLAGGQDRLLARISHRPERAAELVDRIRELDGDTGFEAFLLRLFDHAGLHIEELGRRRYFLLPGHLKADAFPALPAEGMTVTLDRARALEREQEGFLTADHPMVRGALDFLLGSIAGNAAFGVWDSPGEKQMLLEAWLVVECVAPAHLHVERFLPQTPLRIAVDHAGGDRSEDAALTKAKLRRGDPGALMRNPAVKRKVLPGMLERVRKIAAERKEPVVEEALELMRREMQREITRLRDLSEVNDHVRPEEIGLLEMRETELAKAISSARIRLDAVRLVWKAPA